MTKLVWLDAGHGGSDPGAMGHNMKESDIVLDLVKRTGAYLIENFEGVDVRYSRTTDVFISLMDRTNRANAAKADAFVSFHCNAAGSSSANGYEDFIYNGTLRANDAKLQQEVHQSVWDFYKSQNIQTNRGKKKENLHVVRETAMAAVLTENLFMSNPEILRFKEAAFLQGVAAAHAEGIAAFLGLTRKEAKPEVPVIEVKPAAPAAPIVEPKPEAPAAPVVDPKPAAPVPIPPAAAPEANTGMYIVKAGDTLNAIALKYGVTVDAIAKLNNIQSPNVIAIGQALKIPAPAASQPSQYFPATQLGGDSITAALNAIKVDSNFANRQKIAQANGIANYSGTAAQNLQLVKLLKAGKLIDPAAKVSPVPAPAPAPAAPAAPVVVPTAVYFPKTTAGGDSITAGLTAIKVDSGFANRQKIAQANGIANYSGTAAQNLQLVKLLKEGKLINPAGKAPAAPAVNYFPKTTAGGDSIITGLNAIKVDSSFANRTKIAKANGIALYTGTAAQNLKLAELLRQGKLIKP